MKETVIQFGSGNFLRGFFCHFMHILNEKGLYDGKIVIVQPTRNGKTPLINAQNGRYTLFLRGIQNGVQTDAHTRITSVSRGVDPYTDFGAFLALAENPDMRFIVSNTTEAGIVFDDSCRLADTPALSFPGKLTQLLYHRFRCRLQGFVILPCELIDRNADTLRECVLSYAHLWQLGDDFIAWLQTENTFCNTLVDRIVTGYPQEDEAIFHTLTGGEDRLLDIAEPFHLWVIEGDIEGELPLQQAGLQVIQTQDVTPYKTMKVRILNGAHTSLVFPSLLCGVQSVRESLDDALLREYLNTCLYACILPSLDATQAEKDFAAAVTERFANPYIRHLWKSISLHSVSKFRVRVLPSVRSFEKKYGTKPRPLVFALACLLTYYRTQEPADGEQTVRLLREKDLHTVLSNAALWGEDLSDMEEIVREGMEKINTCGIREALQWALS